MKKSVYNSNFYKAQQFGSERSADVIVPLLLEKFPVRSVLDVGCGVGTWLRSFNSQGVRDLTGLDGNYVDRDSLVFPIDSFHAVDLASDFPIDRRYDLACSLEVAEHLPRAAGLGFVGKLCKAAPVVLFSAAIPGQGGTEHINEAWQDYWRKNFEQQGFFPVDMIRWKIWGNELVDWWYQQNTIVYVEASLLVTHSNLQIVDSRISLNVVHPDCYNRQVDLSLSKAMKHFPDLLIKAIKRRVRLL